MTMTPAAKRALAATIRELRGRLLADLHDATESAYRLSVRARDAGLDEAARARRARLEAWISEQLRAQAAGQAAAAKPARSFDDLRREAEARAAYTLLNRLVLLRLMEAPGPPNPDAPAPPSPQRPASCPPAAARPGPPRDHAPRRPKGPTTTTPNLARRPAGRRRCGVTVKQP